MILGKTMRDAVSIRKGGKGAVSLPNILVLTGLYATDATLENRRAEY